MDAKELRPTLTPAGPDAKRLVKLVGKKNGSANRRGAVDELGSPCVTTSAPYP